MPAVAPFNFTLRQSGGNYRPLVFGSSYSTMVVGEIYQEGREFLAIRYWSGGRHESFASIGEARKWLEDSFREQILGEVTP